MKICLNQRRIPAVPAGPAVRLKRTASRPAQPPASPRPPPPDNPRRISAVPAGPAARLKRTAGRPAQPPASPRPPPPDNSWMILAGVGVVAGIVLLVVVIGAAARNSRPSYVPVSRPVETPAVRRAAPPRREAPYRPARFSELGGMTMAEWMARNNTNNEFAESRVQRKNDYYRNTRGDRVSANTGQHRSEP